MGDSTKMSENNANSDKPPKVPEVEEDHDDDEIKGDGDPSQTTKPTTTAASTILPRKRKSGEFLPNANSSSSTENGSTIESIQEEAEVDDIESTSAKVRKIEHDANAAKLASVKIATKEKLDE